MAEVEDGLVELLMGRAAAAHEDVAEDDDGHADGQEDEIDASEGEVIFHCVL